MIYLILIYIFEIIASTSIDYKFCKHSGDITDIPTLCDCPNKPPSGCDVCCVVLTKLETIARCVPVCAESVEPKSSEVYQAILETIIAKKKVQDTKLPKGNIDLNQDLITSMEKPPQDFEESMNSSKKTDSIDSRCFEEAA